jgi:hypothetical protein
LELVHAGYKTDSIELLINDSKYVPFLINDTRILAADEVVCCGGATTLLCSCMLRRCHVPRRACGYHNEITSPKQDPPRMCQGLVGFTGVEIES